MVRICLFEPEKPANVGNIIRTCMALDLSLSLVGKIGFDMSDKALMRAGMDYLIGFKPEYCPDLDTFMERHKDEDIYLVTRYGYKVYTNFDYSNLNRDVCFVFGKESSGLPKSFLRKHLEKTIRIPMAIDARSLNLSNCVAMVAGEALRQRHFPHLASKETIKGEDFLLHAED